MSAGFKEIEEQIFWVRNGAMNAGPGGEKEFLEAARGFLATVETSSDPRRRALFARGVAANMIRLAIEAERVAGV